MSGIQITVEDTGKPELLAWAWEQGVDPDCVTMQAGCLPEIWDGHLSYGYVVQDEQGHDLMDQFHGRIFVVPRWAKVVTTLPAGIGRPIDSCQQLPAHVCPTCAEADTKAAQGEKVAS